jgi:hypothetical protein
MKARLETLWLGLVLIALTFFTAGIFLFVWVNG